MAKLTVYLKNNVVRSYPLEAEKVRVGRDETNDLVVDSPAFAPVHAVIVSRGKNCMIKQLNDDFPLVINGKTIKESRLHEGDTITAGQHSIVYSTDQAGRKIKSDYLPHTANFQIISGANMGKIFPLNIPMTLLGEPGSGIVVISKRKDGYFASILENIGIITLNDQPLDDKMIKLNCHDVLVIGNTTVQFYLK